MTERRSEILIVGGGTGGVAAALAALRMGKSVIMTEPTDWIGGQLTSQAVPPDEHRWVESHGVSNTYRQFREGVRDYYRRYYPLTAEARNTIHLNPGSGLVSRLCHEPRVALAVLEAMLAPYISNGQLDVLLRTSPIAAETEDDRIIAVTVLSAETGLETTIAAPYVLDATELGDVLQLAKIEHVIGAESQTQTGEMHAVQGSPDPFDQQAITSCFALDFLSGQDHTIDKPADYEFWRSYRADFWPGPQLGWDVVHAQTLEPLHLELFQTSEPFDLWRFRRILHRQHFSDDTYRSDVTLVNWPQIDYWLGPVVGVADHEAQSHHQGAQELSLSFLYWMQTEAPRHDGGHGYPELRLRPDVVGTENGLAKHVYVREARRIKAEFTVLEQHLGVEQREGMVGAERFPDTVGTGCYRIDLHPSSSRTYVDISAYPFQIPLGALIPVRFENVLPACKNLGVTHVTNGCFRLHPVEWGIGEVAGTLAALCLTERLVPRQVRNTESHLANFQSMLRRLGVPLEWPEFARLTPV